MCLRTGDACVQRSGWLHRTAIERYFEWAANLRGPFYCRYMPTMTACVSPLPRTTTKNVNYGANGCPKSLVFKVQTRQGCGVVLIGTKWLRRCQSRNSVYAWHLQGSSCGMGITASCDQWQCNRKSIFPARSRWHYLAITMKSPSCSHSGGQ
jgi:hypothetical protein